MEFGGGQELKSDINVTPLVDVMLVMLIIFMLVTPMLQKGVGVTLPRARNVQGVSDNDKEVLTVTLTQNGLLFLSGRPIDRTALPQALRLKHQENPSLQYQIKADRDLTYGQIKKLVQLGREAGFRGAQLISQEIKEQGAPPAGAPPSPTPRTGG